MFGTGEPDGIAAVLEQFCRDHLGSAPAGASFYGASAGCVAGLRLRNGDDIVVKAMQERWSAPYLDAVQSVQARVASAGFPAPRPLLAPAPLRPGRPNLATAESLLPDPGMRALRGREYRAASAAGLARQIALCRELSGVDALTDHPLHAPARNLYGEPHSPLFDFDRSTPASERIDEAARRAVVLREADPSPPVVAHTDWSARNVRLGPGRVVAVYDWDSVACVPESTAVGQAAATWSVTAEPGGSVFPTFGDVTNFVLAYEHAAGYRLSAEQWRATGAAAVYVLAYTARCEDSLEAAGLARPDQRGARDRLADAGEVLLTWARPTTNA